ncbi:hypothetical protein DRE_00770 [Drechslerella stenobrocha 248]|uniref:Uncharacterized protein n=1 Tax=Drechslerella stenobrocha 248 TaxID=1043628 RepID=W7HMW2_9PEZI|nr:hypothetical protein DRE_00770 [Drechslerella stenobrocha 248]
MISIQGTPSTTVASKANILPCSIKYTGPASSSRHLWDPTSQPSPETGANNPGAETHTAYFRGRKLAGTKITIPDGYQGHVLTTSDLPPTGTHQREVLQIDDEQGEEDESGEVAENAQWASASWFSDIIVWGHEVVVDKAQDGVVKGIDEWIGMSQILNGYSIDDK